jgi:glutaredoxin
VPVPPAATAATTAAATTTPAAATAAAAAPPGAGLQLLYTSYGSSLVQVTETSRLKSMLEQRRVFFEQIDGATDVDKRRELWERSGKRGYPQLFFNGDYFGDFDTIQVHAQRSTASAAQHSAQKRA